VSRTQTKVASLSGQVRFKMRSTHRLAVRPGDHVSWPRRPSHQDLAEMVGTYRQTAMLTLDDFKRRGLVELGRRQIRIVDHLALEALAQR
jgi:CRP-like cAMP-binding protein